MLAVIKENLQFLILLLVWVVIGAFGGPVIYAILPLTIFLLMRKELYEEIFIGFWFILILSDNLLMPTLAFSKGVKNIYILLLVMILIVKRKEFAPVNRYVLRYTAFFLVSFIAMAYSVTLPVTIQKTLSYIFIFFAVPNYVEKLYRENGNGFLRRLTFFFSFILLISLVLKYLDPTLAVSHGGRLTGIFGNPNGLGIFCVLTFLLFSVINDLQPDAFSIWDKRIIYLLIIACVLMSGSRNSSVAILIFLFFSRFYKISPFLGFIFLLVFIVVFEIVSNNYIQIITALGLQGFFRLETLEQGGGRYIAWKFAWEQIQHAFFLGRGFAFDEYIMRKNYEMLSKLGHEGGVHNVYLILWLNTGLVGLIFYFWSFITTFIQGMRVSKLSVPVMYTVMFTIMFEPWLVSSLNPFTIILLMIITMLLNPMFRQSADDNEEPKENIAPRHSPSPAV